MTYTLKKLMSVLKEKGYFCWYCGELAQTLDHFNPRCKGGGNENNNLIPSCQKCNFIKHARTLETFRNIMARKALGMPRFTEEQKHYLVNNGFKFPELKHDFWFEKRGKKI